MLEGHNGIVIAVAISADGDKIVSGGDDNSVRVWSAETGEVLACQHAYLYVYYHQISN